VDGPVVTVYSRQGCHLCAEAERLVAVVAAGRAEVRVVDVDEDPVLVERYTVRVPVVAVDGVEVAELVVDAEAVERALARALS
jgi:glutaredoxin